MSKIEVWDWVDRLSKIVVALGVPLFFVEQYLHWERDKATNTLEFVKKFQDTQLVNQRFALLSAWMQYDIRQLQAAGPSKKAIDDAVLKIVNASVVPGKTDLRAAVFDIVDFYETLKVCIDSNRCDGEMAVSYFSEYAHRFFCLYQPYILKLREQQAVSSYGKRLEEFALAYKTCGV